MRWITVIAVLLVAVVSCSEQPTEITINQPVDTLLVPPVTDTVFVPVVHVDTVPVFVVDTLFVWCWENDHNNDGHTATYTCTNGYQGPLFP